MPFEPLRTDEKITSTDYPRSKTLEQQLLGGCTLFVVAAFIDFGLGLWPFFIFREVRTWSALGLTAGVGMTCSTIFAFTASRLGRDAGWFGSMGGTLACCTFFYLWVGQVSHISQYSSQKPIEYPQFIGWLVPLVWFLLSIAAGIMMPRKKVESG